MVSNKTNRLSDYLTAYSNILNNEKKRWLKGYYYIDAFAGSVTPRDKEDKIYIEGSPLRALNTQPHFDGFIFIEKNSKKVKENILPLKNLYPNRNIHIFPGDCNKVLLEEIVPQFNPTNERAFIFLDPYGIELKWTTVEAIGRSKIFDVFINFSVMGIFRQLKPSGPRQTDKVKINELMGYEDWFKMVYKKDDQGHLFETNNVFRRTSEQLVDRLINCYRERLYTCYSHVSNTIIMRISKNGPMYALMLASQKPQAVDRMNGILKRLDKMQKERISHEQLPLFNR